MANITNARRVNPNKIIIDFEIAVINAIGVV